jgi:hypothetical protein
MCLWLSCVKILFQTEEEDGLLIAVSDAAAEELATKVLQTWSRVFPNEGPPQRERKRVVLDIALLVSSSVPMAHEHRRNQDDQTEKLGGEIQCLVEVVFDAFKEHERNDKSSTTDVN